MRSRPLFVLMFALIAVAAPLSILSQGQSENGSLEYLDLSIDSEVRNHYAVTEFGSRIFNPTSSDLESILEIRIPDDAMLTNLSVEMDGRTHYGSVVSRESAQEQYDEAKENDETASRITSPSPNRFLLYVNVRAETEINVTIRYEQIVKKVMGRYEFELDMDALSLYTAFDSVETRVYITGTEEILGMDTSGSTVDPEESSDGNRTWILEHGTDHPAIGDKVEVSFEESSPPSEGTMETYVNGGKGYFMHIFSPEMEDVGTYLPKDIIFVLDRSGSMEGEKISQLKDAFREIVGQVHAEDRFDIITFSEDIDTWKGEIVPASENNKGSAADYIDYISAGGSTNIVDALRTALDQMEYGRERVPAVVFLTDGLPTSGDVQEPYGIRNEILEKNQNGASIYSLGFGHDLDFPFIRALSLENNGFALAIPEGEDASSLMTDFYDTISTPLVKDIEFDYPGHTFDVIPGALPSLHEGSEAVVVGRFDPSMDNISSRVTGYTSAGQSYWNDTFPVNRSGDNDMVERLWAHRMILRTLDDIAVEGETEALVNKVISLAMNHSFATPYTSFILVIEEDSNEADQELEQGSVDDDVDYGEDGGEYERSGDAPLVPVSDPNNSGSGDEKDDTSIPLPAGVDDNASMAGIWILIVSVLAVLVISFIVGGVIYSRLKEDDLLKQKNRKRIYKHIMENPGDHFRSIQRALDLEVGTLSHHMNILEKEQLIISEQDGNNRCFWVAGVERETGKVRLSRIQENILKEIQSEPGITQVQIAKKLGVSRKVVFYHVKFLSDARMVMEQKVKRRAHYYPTD